ncbi:L,D-transpeptidase [Acuticoccus sp. MNP-M23]|uniref:L,D-transpeptidase n=1 Tax=Acuticoccus sp. MNP-M23 TaxID=3072793 RepID=UPI00281543DC|nr:L,D-transpeptidase [Acuticoccus sp. MNP-M23]WMS44747.1 L,D-transpeptidase [Acuticoccus sp. MNP-M23]
MSRRAFCVLGAGAAAAAVAGCAPEGSFQQATLGYKPVPQLGTPEKEPFQVPRVNMKKIPTNLHRQYVNHTGRYKPGTLVVDVANKHLYLIQDDDVAIRYGIGVGRAGFAWGGEAYIGRKARWPTWTPPASMIRREPELREWAGGMEGGPSNPLGARALYLYRGGRDTLYRLHGTNNPASIGQAMSSGCIRMLNTDVIDLYERVPSRARVVVSQNGVTV